MFSTLLLYPMESFTGKWQGAYTYGPQYDKMLREKPVPFTIEFINTDGILEGLCVDSNLVDIFPEPLVITGSIEEIYISFFKHLPHYIRIEQTGTIYQNREREGLPVHFLGTYDQSNDVFFGVWEIERPENSWETSSDFAFIAGEWFIKRTVKG